MFNIFPDLLNLQISCHITDKKSGKARLDTEAFDVLRMMYPNFKVVKSEFEMRPGQPFIYIGKSEYINKIKERTEPHVIVASTGEYNLSDRSTLINLGYSHKNGGWVYIHKDENIYGSDDYHVGKNGVIDPDYLMMFKADDYTKQGKGRPKYMTQDLIDSWSQEQFIYNVKYLWVVGDVPIKEVDKSKLFYDIMTSLNSPYEMLTKLLKATDLVGAKYVENSLLEFIQKSRNINEVNTKSGMMVKTRQSFHNSCKGNVKQAVENALISPIDDTTLFLMNFLIDLTCKGVKKTWIQRWLNNI